MSNDANTVYTFGWDTAFGIPAPDANKAIVDKDSSPKSFLYKESTFEVTSDFGNWQICEGGSGKNIRFSIPLTDVVLTYTSTKKVVKSQSGTAIMEVNMHFVPHTLPSDSTVQSNPKALIVKSTSESESEPAAVLVSLELSTDVGTVSKAIIEEGLKQWLNENLAEFDHIFSVVDLNRMIDQGKWGFVTPNYTSYAYLDGKNLDDSVLGVLTMTGDRTGEKLDEQISPNVIPGSSVAGFLVSQKRTLYDLVRPAIEQAYSGLNSSNFLMNDAGTKLYLEDGVSVDLKPVEHNGSTYYPKLNQLSVQSNGQILTLQSITTTEIAAGITAECTSTHWYEVTLGKSTKGQTLKFKESQDPDIVHTIHRSEGSIITEIIIAIVVAIAVIILTILTDGAVLIVGGLIAGLILGADMIVPDVIEDMNRDDSPSIDLLTVNAVDPIVWTSSSKFALDYASLNVSMQLGGNPLFT